jgi:type IV secretory pathway VirB9-like protein
MVGQLTIVTTRMIFMLEDRGPNVMQQRRQAMMHFPADKAFHRAYHFPPEMPWSSKEPWLWWVNSPLFLPG